MLPQSLKLTYYPWITQHVAPQDLRRWINTFATELQKALSNELKVEWYVEVLQPVEVPRQVEMIATQQCHVALMNPLGYVFARGRSKNAKSIAIALREIDGKIGATYYGQLYVAKKSAIRRDQSGNLVGLRNRTIGFGVPYSTSNFLIPAYFLSQKGFHPFASFSRVEFYGGHDLVAKAVYEGRVDVGAGHDGVIVDLSNQYGYGDATEKLVQIGRSDPIPSDPIVVNIIDDGLREAVGKALIVAASSTDGKQALTNFWGNVQGLQQITEDAYDGIQSSLDTLGLKEADLLR
jgi:phosphate/phosphite/phosphonate ABC transporter binding protein